LDEMIRVIFDLEEGAQIENTFMEWPWPCRPCKEEVKGGCTPTKASSDLDFIPTPFEWIVRISRRLGWERRLSHGYPKKYFPSNKEDLNFALGSDYQTGQGMFAFSYPGKNVDLIDNIKYAEDVQVPEAAEFFL